MIRFETIYDLFKKRMQGYIAMHFPRFFFPKKTLGLVGNVIKDAPHTLNEKRESESHILAN